MDNQTPQIKHFFQNWTLYKTIQFLKPYYRPYTKLLVLAMVFSVVFALSEFAFMRLIKLIQDNLLVRLQAQKLNLYLGFLLLVTVVKLGARYCHYLLLTYSSEKMVGHIRDALFGKLIKNDLSFFDHNAHGSIMSRLLQDVGMLEQATEYLLAILREPLRLTAYLIYMISVDFKLTIAFFAIIPVLSFSFKKIGEYTKKSGTKANERTAELSEIADETFSAIPIIKIFGLESQFKGRFEKINNHLVAHMIKVRRAIEFAPVFTELLTTFIVILAMFYIAQQIFLRHMSSGEFLSFLIALGLIKDPIRALADMNTRVNKAYSAIERMQTLLNEPVYIINGKQEYSGFCKQIELNISEFSHPRPLWIKDERQRETGFHSAKMPDNVSGAGETGNLSESKSVLHHINLTIKAGSSIALVGPSGAGKSTLANLIARFYPVSDGSILWDGRDVNQLDISSVQKNIAVVSQDLFLFNDTISENVKVGNKQASAQAIEEACTLAHAHDFIMKLPEGYHTVVGHRGVKLSGGQKQRISIARAILKNAPVLILDEATSSLDSESEQIIQESIQLLLKSRTSIIIAHRYSTIRHVDQIWLMDKGTVVDVGNHEELFARNGLYHKLYETQLH